MMIPNPHAHIDAENLARDRRIATLIRRDPTVIEVARENLRAWAEKWGGLNGAWQEWERILRMLTPAQLADFLESTTPMAMRLRQSTPFLGVLEAWSARATYAA